MRYLRESREEEMIAVFLRAEFASPRFGAAIRHRLHVDGMPDRIVTAPELASATQNRYRRQLLGVYRGFGRDADLLHRLPPVVRWQWMALMPDELRQVHYIDYDY